MDQFIAENNLLVKKRLELTPNEAVKQALLAGLGYSIMPLIGLKNELMINDLQIIPVVGLPLHTTWMLTWHKDKQFSPVAQAFMVYLRENKTRIIEQHFGWYERF